MADAAKIIIIRAIEDESSSIPVACKLLQINAQERNAVNFCNVDFML